MSKLDELTKRYWNTFRQGYIAVGGKPDDYPEFDAAHDPIIAETKRSLRHAAEELRDVWGKPFDEVFPEALADRALPMQVTDERFSFTQKLAKLEGDGAVQG